MAEVDDIEAYLEAQVEGTFVCLPPNPNPCIQPPTHPPTPSPNTNTKTAAAASARKETTQAQEDDGASRSSRSRRSR